MGQVILARTSLVVSIILISLGSSAAGFGHPAQDRIELEDYAVYSVLINAIRPGTTRQMLLIREKTSTRLGVPLVQTDELAPELLEDFRLKNVTAFRLENQFSLANKYHIASEAEEREMFTGIVPIITLSRIGFNSMKDEALVLMTLHTELMNNREYFVLLTREGEKWRVARKLAVIR